MSRPALPVRGARAAAAFALACAAALAPSASGCADASPLLAREGFTLGARPYTLGVAPDGLGITLRRGETTLLVLDAAAFQLGVVDALDDQKSYDPWDVERRGESDAGITFFSPRLASPSLDADGRRAQIELDYGGGLAARLVVGDEGDGAFRLVLVPEEGGAASSEGAGSRPRVALARVRARTTGDPREGFYGLGEQQDSVDNRGKLRAMQLEADLDLESANNEAHVPVPFLVGTRGWAMFVDNDRAGVFDVARKDPAAIEATFAVASTAGEPATRLSVWLFAGEHPLDLVKAAYRVGGKAKLPAPWALGPWIWRDESQDQKEVVADIAAIRALDLATSGIWVDRPYARAVNSFDFDPARFPDPPAMIGAAHRAGLTIALWSTPYLEPAAQPLRAQAEAGGYFPPGTGIPFNKWSPPIDFTNPDAYTFWTTLVRRYVALGIDGFKLDYGEDVVPSLADRRNVWRFAAGDERTMHFHYSGLYHRSYDEALDRLEGAFLLCRAAHYGEQRRGVVIWPGDMDATFTKHRERFVARDGKEVTGVGGLPATIVMGLSLGVSGFPFFGADTGGYRHSPPDAELYVRWFEQTALSTVMQVGDSSSQPPWVFTPDNGRTTATVDVYRTYARLHLRLFPYEWTYAHRIAADGKPIQRPLGLAHPELGVHPSDAYLFGEELLVAPVVTRGERRREVIAPAGTWVDWWDGATFVSDGRAPLSIDAPLEKLPLLMRDGALVPMLRPTIDTLAPADDEAVDSFARDPGLLWVRVAPGRPRRFTLWDRSTVERTSDGSLAFASGDVFTRGFVFEAIATPEPREILREEESGGSRVVARRASSAELEAAPEGWTWEPARRGTLTVRLSPGRGRARLR